MTNRKLSVIVIILILFSLNKFRTAKVLNTYLINLSKFPLEVITFSFNRGINFINKGELKQENKRLKQEIKVLEQKVVELQETAQENERLRGLLSFKKENYSTIPAQVIGESSNNWRKVIIINKGEDDGLVEDMVVVTKEGLVGRVTGVGLGSSRVMLIIDFNSKVAAFVQRTREQGVVEGITCSCEMRYIDKYSNIRKGDMIISSGKGGIYPKGLIIGKVDALNEDVNKLQLKAAVSPAVDFCRLEEVLCLKKGSL